MVELKRLGFDIVEADLEKPLDSVIFDDCNGCYIHSTSSDTHELDPKEVDKARNLCDAIVNESDIQKVVYNSAAASQDHGVLGFNRSMTWNKSLKLQVRNP